MVGFTRRRKTGKPARFKTAGEGNRVIVVFGPPSSGVSTMVSCLSAASETSTLVVPYLGRQSLPQIGEALNHAEVVLVDVDGGVLGAQDIQGLVDDGFLTAGSGAVIRIYVDDQNINARARQNPENGEGHISFGDLRQWAQDLLDVEDRIQAHSLRYFMVPNFDLEDGVKNLALRAGITK